MRQRKKIGLRELTFPTSASCLEIQDQDPACGQISTIFARGMRKHLFLELF